MYEAIDFDNYTEEECGTGCIIRKTNYLGQDYYRVTKYLGNGEFGNVFECTNKEMEKFAVKIISKSNYLMISDELKFNMKLASVTQNEINIHSRLDHKNIVKFIEMFQDNSNIYMILELCDTSLSRIINRNLISMYIFNKIEI